MNDLLRTLLTIGVTTSDLSHKAESEHILQQLVKTSETLLYTNADSELAPAEEQLVHDTLATIDTEFDPLESSPMTSAGMEALALLTDAIEYQTDISASDAGAFLDD